MVYFIKHNMNYQKACLIIQNARIDPSLYPVGDIRDARDFLNKHFMKCRDDGELEAKRKFPAGKQRDMIISQLKHKCRDQKEKLRLIMEEIRQKLPNKGRKTNIGNILREQVWCYTNSLTTGQAPCYCCEKTMITVWNFQAGHIKPECYGGPTIRENLRPICAECNQKMGTDNMYRYMLKLDELYGGDRCYKLMDCKYAEGYDDCLSEDENFYTLEGLKSYIKIVH